MAKREKVIPTLKELREDMKDMTFREKVDHIWTYYKEYMAVVGVALLLLIAIISSSVSASRNIVVSGVMCNISITPQGMTFFTDDFAKELEIDQKRDIAELNYTSFRSLEDPTSGEDNYNATMVLVSMVAGGRMDYAIIDDIALDFYMTQDVFLDLREFFTAEQLAELDAQGLVHYYQFIVKDMEGNIVEEEAPYPVAVSLANTKFAKTHIDNEKVYFCVSGNDPDMELTMQLFERLMHYE